MASLQSDSRVAESIRLWRFVYDALNARIRNGELSPGTRLPTEHRLASEFGAHRHTVRKALHHLALDGTITAEQGRGTFVTDPATSYYIGRRTRFGSNVQRAGRDAGTNLIGWRNSGASGEVASLLDIPERAPITVLYISNLIDGIPVSLTHYFFSADRFSNLAKIFKGSLSVTTTLQEFGIEDYFRRETQLSIRNATREEARQLGQDPTRPVYETRSINVDLNGSVIQLTRGVVAGARVKFIFEEAMHA